MDENKWRFVEPDEDGEVELPPGPPVDPGTTLYSFDREKGTWFYDLPPLPNDKMIFEDERGTITEVAEGDFKAIQMIFSKKGSIRSNHYHKKGGHLLHVVSGSMRYVEEARWPMNTERIVRAGESVFTGPGVPHACEFLEDTLMVCAATVNRAGGAYAEDLVKVKLL